MVWNLMHKYLNTWAFWVLLAYLGLVLTMVFSIKSIEKSNGDHAILRATAKANEVNCLNSIPVLIKANNLVRGVIDFHKVVTQANHELYVKTPTGSPLKKVRQRYYKRLKATIPLVTQLHFKVPTKAECDKLGESKP